MTDDQHPHRRRARLRRARRRGHAEASAPWCEGSVEGRRRLEELRAVAASMAEPPPPLTEPGRAALIARALDRADADAEPATARDDSRRARGAAVAPLVWRRVGGVAAAVVAAIALVGGIAALARGTGHSSSTDSASTATADTVAMDDEGGRRIATRPRRSTAPDPGRPGRPPRCRGGARPYAALVSATAAFDHQFDAPAEATPRPATPSPRPTPSAGPPARCHPCRCNRRRPGRWWASRSCPVVRCWSWTTASRRRVTACWSSTPPPVPCSPTGRPDRGGPDPALREGAGGTGVGSPAMETPGNDEPSPSGEPGAGADPDPLFSTRPPTPPRAPRRPLPRPPTPGPALADDGEPGPRTSAAVRALDEVEPSSTAASRATGRPGGRRHRQRRRRGSRQHHRSRSPRSPGPWSSASSPWSLGMAVAVMLIIAAIRLLERSPSVGCVARLPRAGRGHGGRPEPSCSASGTSRRRRTGILADPEPLTNIPQQGYVPHTGAPDVRDVRRPRRRHHRVRPRRAHRRHLHRPRQPRAAGDRGRAVLDQRPARRPAHAHHRGRELPRLPRRDHGPRAHGATSASRPIRFGADVRTEKVSQGRLLGPTLQESGSATPTPPSPPTGPSRSSSPPAPSR